MVQGDVQTDDTHGTSGARVRFADIELDERKRELLINGSVPARRSIDLAMERAGPDAFLVAETLFGPLMVQQYAQQIRLRQQVEG